MSVGSVLVEEVLLWPVFSSIIPLPYNFPSPNTHASLSLSLSSCRHLCFPPSCRSITPSSSADNNTNKYASSGQATKATWACCCRCRIIDLRIFRSELASAHARVLVVAEANGQLLEQLLLLLLLPHSHSVFL